MSDILSGEKLTVCISDQLWALHDCVLRYMLQGTLSIRASLDKTLLS